MSEDDRTSDSVDVESFARKSPAREGRGMSMHLGGMTLADIGHAARSNRDFPGGTVRGVAKDLPADRLERL